MSHKTAVDPIFIKTLDSLNFRPKTIVEIGTYKGESAAILARYCDKVITIDVDESNRDDQIGLWVQEGVVRKIQRVVMYSSIYRRRWLEKTDFDFAFIDGSHLWENVERDFEDTKKCGCVLFHDYWQEDGGHPDVRAFVDTLSPSATIDIPFALWQKTP